VIGAPVTDMREPREGLRPTSARDLGIVYRAPILEKEQVVVSDPAVCHIAFAQGQMTLDHFDRPRTQFHGPVHPGLRPILRAT
jgi:hypothetical protein